MEVYQNINNTRVMKLLERIFLNFVIKYYNKSFEIKKYMRNSKAFQNDQYKQKTCLIHGSQLNQCFKGSL